MLMPSIFGGNLFDDWFDFPEHVYLPEFRDTDKTERKLYGRRADRLMKTDIQEHKDHYQVAIDLPGFKKEEINLELSNGYLTVSAAKNLEEKKEEKGRVIRSERYSGSMQRSFYVGEEMTEEDITAKFENGVLSLTLAKKDAPKIPEKKTIMING